MDPLFVGLVVLWAASSATPGAATSVISVNDLRHTAPPLRRRRRVPHIEIVDTGLNTLVATTLCILPLLSSEIDMAVDGRLVVIY